LKLTTLICLKKWINFLFSKEISPIYPKPRRKIEITPPRLTGKKNTTDDCEKCSQRSPGYMCGKILISILLFNWLGLHHFWWCYQFTETIYHIVIISKVPIINLNAFGLTSNISDFHKSCGLKKGAAFMLDSCFSLSDNLKYYSKLIFFGEDKRASSKTKQKCSDFYSFWTALMSLEKDY